MFTPSIDPNNFNVSRNGFRAYDVLYV